MAAIKRFEEIQAWQKARELVREVYRTSSKGEFGKDFGLKDQIRRAAVSSMSNVAEGFTRRGNKEFAHYLDMARASAAEVQSLLYVALDAGFIDKNRFEGLYWMADETISIISGFTSYLRKADYNDRLQYRTPNSMTVFHKPRAIVITISDSASRGEREDLSGPAAREELEKFGCEVVKIQVIPDDQEKIQGCIIEHSENPQIDLVVTTGGTGLSPRDVTPEATLAVIEKQVPGIAELMRLEGIKVNPRAALSRAVAGVRNRSLIVNLPGSVKGVRESLGAISKILGHALEVVSGNTVRCGG